ncbi:MAG: ferrochelatase [Ignavibacteriae bacterium]|nr:ferrochelatase [Ignavibacteriota bacterium]
MRKKNDKPIGVVLLQLGGPDSLETVEPFLYNLFCDPDIIDLPLAFLFRKALARIISGRRAPKVQEYYRRIGGKSPILKLTMRQARSLERELQGKLNANVYISMRYWHPMTDEVVDRLYRDGVERVVLLPLYPHYSKTTTGSSVNEWNRVMSHRGLNHLSVTLVDEYCDHPLYIAALVRNINIALNRVAKENRSKVHLVFSAHGTPVKLVRAGDPYQQQIIRTYNAVVEQGVWGLQHHLCYQSKVGPEKWLEPSLEDTIKRLAGEKVSHLIVIPIAFVSDHSETLWEINMESKQEARALGIKYFDMSPALNTNPMFIKALADVVVKKVCK